MKKKVLLLMASALLMLAMVPAAFAAETPVSNEAELTAALSTAANGDTITLSADITLTKPVDVNTAITIDGGANKYALTAPAGQHVLNIPANAVTVKNVTLNASGAGYAINATGSKLTVTDCNINAVQRGISFYPKNGQGAALTVSGTKIKNPDIANYDTDAKYGDYRGIATMNVQKGKVSVTDSEILGYGYSLNASVKNDATGLRDGQNTVFDIKNTTIKGWTALNMWSANSAFNFTNCHLTGISQLNGEDNNYATINMNGGIYANDPNNGTKVTFAGGTIDCYQYGTAAQLPFFVDDERFSVFQFEEYDLEPVVITSHVLPNVSTPTFGFIGATQEQMQHFIDNNLIGLENLSIYSAPIATNAVSVFSATQHPLFASFDA